MQALPLSPPAELCKLVVSEHISATEQLPSGILSRCPLEELDQSKTALV